MRISVALLLVIGASCSEHGQSPADAPIDAVADAPPDAERLLPCAEVCPDEQTTPWTPGGVYEWSYCLPSYRRCIGPH